MKKIFLSICLCMATFALIADVPKIIVNKANGGPSAIFNRYNYVTYTPSDGSTYIMGTLDCTGNGYTKCRVPRGSDLMLTNPNYGRISNVNINGTLVNAINDLIEFSETQSGNGIYQGQKSQTIAVRNPNTRGFDTYMVNAKWRYNRNGDGQMIITIYQGALGSQRL